MKRIVSILAALALAASVMTGVSAAETANATSGGLMQMSDSEKEAFINENLDVRLQHLSTLVTLSANRLYDEIADEVEAALGDGLKKLGEEIGVSIHIQHEDIFNAMHKI